MAPVVRNTWYEVGADFTKFDKAARDYQRLYLSRIQESPNRDDTYTLPSSTRIEEDYLTALEKNHVSPYAAIHANFALANKRLGSNVVTWTDILGLEPERWRNSTLYKRNEFFTKMMKLFCQWQLVQMNGKNVLLMH